MLHVTNGESAGNTLRRTTLGGAVLPLAGRPARGAGATCGASGAAPGPRRLPLALRLGRPERPALVARAPRPALRRPAPRPRRRRALVRARPLRPAAAARRARARPRGGARARVDRRRLVSGRPRFLGLGELTADELETLWPERRTATAEALDEAAAAWDAFRAPEPSALADRARDASELPFLGAALRRLLEELPSTRGGLSGTERRALEAIAAGAATPAAAFVAAQRLEEAPFLGDNWFYRALAALGAGARRLVETEGAPLPQPPPLGDASVFTRAPLRLTENGERVLRGELDRVELLGVDRWLGGARLRGTAVWRRDPLTGALLPPT